MEKEDTANKINELLLTNLLDHERLCSICGKKLPWDCQSDKCRACRDMIQGIKNEKYKPVFRGRRKRRRYCFKYFKGKVYLIIKLQIL